MEPRPASAKVVIFKTLLMILCFLTTYIMKISDNRLESHSCHFLFSLQVVSNLPFNISTEVIKQLLPMGDIFSDVVLLLQVSSEPTCIT